jgi:hypothetical protein
MSTLGQNRNAQRREFTNRQVNEIHKFKGFFNTKFVYFIQNKWHF